MAEKIALLPSSSHRRQIDQLDVAIRLQAGHSDMVEAQGDVVTMSHVYLRMQCRHLRCELLLSAIEAVVEDVVSSSVSGAVENAGKI